MIDMTTSNRNNLRSQSLDLLRFPLALVVLIIHTFNTNGLTIQGNTLSIDDMPILLAVNRFIDGFLRGQSVPIYFFISGYVFFIGSGLTKDKYLNKIKNRVKSLLIPYIIWNLIGILKRFITLMPCLAHVFPGGSKTQLDLSFPAILMAFWDRTKCLFVEPVSVTVSNDMYPITVPLWFIRDLMIVVVCTPLLYWLFRHTRHYFVLILGIVWFALYDFNLGHIHQLITAFFFFSWGGYMSVYQKDMISEFGKYFKASMWIYPLMALLFVFTEYYIPHLSSTVKRLNVFVGLFFAYNISAWLLRHKHCKVIPFLASASFFIYVAHSLICGEFVKIFFVTVKPDTELGMIFMYFSAVIVTVVILLSIYYILRRYTPSFLKIIAGGK